MKGYHRSIHQGLLDIMRSHSDAVLIGEDICDPFGGCYNMTRGFSKRFNGRVINTPISEGGIMGLANGLSLMGFHPIVEIMFYDFMTLCLDQILNHAIPLKTNILIRTVVGDKCYGYTHSKDLDYIFSNVMTVFHPMFDDSPGSVLKEAFDTDGVVLFVEEKRWY